MRVRHGLVAAGRLSCRGLVWIPLIAVLGCGFGAERADESPPPRSYQVRGVVRHVAAPGADPRQLSIHHEAIADFVGSEGVVVGMEVMTMPFTVAEEVELNGLQPGAKIAFVLMVDWSAAEPALITAIERLPEDTRLSFETRRGPE